MEIICIKSGKCLKELSGIIDVQKGDKGRIIEKNKRGEVIAFLNGERVLIPFEHVSGEVIHDSTLACFKLVEEVISESKKIKILKSLLEKYTGKKVILK